MIAYYKIETWYIKKQINMFLFLLDFSLRVFNRNIYYIIGVRVSLVVSLKNLGWHNMIKGVIVIS